MQRYFVTPDQFEDDRVVLDGEDAHHLSRVLRAQPGDSCIVSDGVSKEALVAVVAVGKDRVETKVVEWLAMTSEPAVDVWIAQSLPKGDKMELVIQKGTEIGAARFIPFVSERTIVQLEPKKEAKRLERWRKIAKEAAEQAHRNRIPEIEAPVGWKELLKLAAAADASFLCYEKEDKQELRKLIREALNGRSAAATRVLLIVGPEGGFTEAEAREAEAAGCRTVGLGKRILRTETAALVGLTCILYESGEMGGAT